MKTLGDSIYGPMDLPEGVSIEIPPDALPEVQPVLGDATGAMDAANALDAAGEEPAKGAPALEDWQGDEPLDVDAFVREGVREELAGQSGADAGGVLKVAGATAVAVALATTLATAPIDVQKAQLPEPVPIVQVYTPPMPDQPPATPDDDADDSVSAKQKILKLLKYALIALAFAGACLLGATQAGCTACSGMLGIPILAGDGASQSQTGNAQQAQAV